MGSHEHEQVADRAPSTTHAALLTQLFARASVGLAVWDAEGRLELVNPAFREMFLFDLAHDHNVLKDPVPRIDGMAERFRRAYAGEPVFIPTFWYDASESNGSREPKTMRVAMSVILVPLFDASGALEHVVASYRNETDMMTTAEQLRVSEARKTAVMEAALDAIVLMDHEGRITDFNPAAEKMFGYSRGEVVGKPLAETLIPVSLRAQHVAGLKRYLTTGQVSVLGRRVELPAMRKDGIEFPAEVAIVRIRSAGPPIFTGYIRDITERRRAAESEMLRREKEAAETANGELEAFSYSVAHDLRAPLRAITGYSTALQEDHADHLNQDAKHQLERIVAAGVRMGEIIDSLLSLARLTRTDLHRQTVDLVVLTESIMEQLRGSEPERRVDLVTPGQLVVRGDPQLLRILLENLLSNAWKFTRKQVRPRIELGTTLVDERRAYFVRDNGAGFNMEYAAKLFIPFQRLHSPEQFEGTGVGLATVQRVVRRHGGRVWAEGSENQGATFYFTLRQERFTRGRT